MIMQRVFLKGGTLQGVLRSSGGFKLDFPDEQLSKGWQLLLLLLWDEYRLANGRGKQVPA